MFYAQKHGLVNEDRDSILHITHYGSYDAEYRTGMNLQRTWSCMMQMSCSKIADDQETSLCGKNIHE